MSSESPAQGSHDPFIQWIRAIVPVGCTPIGWCHKPIHRHILDNAPDVVDATKAAISQSFGDIPHVVVEIRSDDAAARSSDELANALDRTDGGLLLVGVSYERH